jgi:S1-C subfamily serine protease
LTAGDIIVKIGDMDVTNLQAMTDALRSHVAGDVVQVQYLRGGNRLSSTVTLGVRPAS